MGIAHGIPRNHGKNMKFDLEKVRIFIKMLTRTFWIKTLKICKNIAQKPWKTAKKSLKKPWKPWNHEKIIGRHPDCFRSIRVDLKLSRKNKIEQYHFFSYFFDRLPEVQDTTLSAIPSTRKVSPYTTKMIFHNKDCDNYFAKDFFFIVCLIEG